MVNYPSIATKIKAGFAKGGTTVTLRRTTTGTYDPAAGSYSGSTTTDYTVTVLILSRRIYVSSQVGQTYFNGILVQTDDQFLLVAADGLSIVPAPGDIITISGVSYTLVTMIPLRPGGVDLFYRILARK